MSAAARLPLAACLLAILIGLIGLGMFGAPPMLLAVNGAAATIGLLLAVLIQRWKARAGAGAAMLLLALFAAPLLFGPELDDVRRWVALGPLRLHVGMLVVPALMVIAAGLPARTAAGVVAAASLVAVLQPDLATALALASAAVAIAIVAPRDPWRWLALLPAGGATLWCLLHRDTLAPVRFVEGLWSDAAARAPLLLLAMLAAALLLIAAPLIRWRAAGRRLGAAAALSASVFGYMLASANGAYPVPLFGSGASPIIGFLLAIALLARHAPGEPAVG